MARLCRFILCLLLIWGACSGTAVAAAPSEKGLFTSASQALQDGFYSKAEEDFASFVQLFPASPKVPEAILRQAEARLKLKNYAGAVELLSGHLAQAGPLSADYLFRLGQTFLLKGEPRSAADTFSKLIQQAPTSPYALEASVSQATALASLGEWAQVIALLRQTNGVFQTAARAGVSNQLVIRGFLLLGEALFAQARAPAQFLEVEEAVKALAGAQLSPDLAWQYQYLVGRGRLAAGRLPEALQATTNLLTLATNTAQPQLQAESIAFKAGLLERLGRPDEAIGQYELNLRDGFPADRQRQALLKITELALALNQVDRAAQMLDKFCAQNPEASSADLALLTLGELRLRQHASLAGETPSPSPANTNALQQARTALDMLLTRKPQSPLIAKARLDLGWVLWLEGKWTDAQAAFQAAVERLPMSPDLAAAHFKLGDTQFRLNDFAGALTNYAAVVEKFENAPEVKTNLFEPALYQTVRAALAATNYPAATNALARLLASYPKSFHTERAVLLAGQGVSNKGDPAAARAIFTDFVKAVPGSSLGPELQLAIARTYEQENKWENAIGLYQDWLSRFTNGGARPRAEFYFGWANYQARRETNAFNTFTNFLARYPTNELAPLARWWLGDYYLRNGNAVEAEKSYKQLFQDGPPSALTYQAIMMAGRAAWRQQTDTSLRTSTNYFLMLCNDTNCPADLRLQALSAYGDYFVSCESSNKIADYREAINIFTSIYESSPTSRLGLAALGQKASCLLQWALKAQQPDSLTNAVAALQHIVAATNATVAARSIARVALAVVLEKQADWPESRPPAEKAPLLQQALTNCLEVLYFDKSLPEGEKPDAFWIKEAGLRAARLAERLQDWNAALRVYERLREWLPPLAPMLDKKILKARDDLARAKTG
jgi:TolA-binding protein